MRDKMNEEMTLREFSLCLQTLPLLSVEKEEGEQICVCPPANTH